MGSGVMLLRLKVSVITIILMLFFTDDCSVRKQICNIKQINFSRIKLNTKTKLKLMRYICTISSDELLDTGLSILMYNDLLRYSSRLRTLYLIMVKNYANIKILLEALVVPVKHHNFS